MGYELEIRTRERTRARDVDARARELVRRWQIACERLDDALVEQAALRGRVDVNDPAWIALRLRVAQARHRRHEIAEQMEALDPDPDA